MMMMLKEARVTISYHQRTATNLKTETDTAAVITEVPASIIPLLVNIRVQETKIDTTVAAAETKIEAGTHLLLTTNHLVILNRLLLKARIGVGARAHIRAVPLIKKEVEVAVMTNITRRSLGSKCII